VKQRLAVLTEIIAPYRVAVFNALAARGDVDLHVVFLSETDPTLRDWAVERDRIRFSYQVLRSWRVRAGRYHELLTAGVGRALTEWGPDVVVCGGYNYVASWTSQAWAVRRRLPFVLWCESTGRDRRRALPPVELVKRRFIRRCRGFVVPGRASREYLQALGAADRPIAVAPNAVDVERFRQGAAVARRDADAVRAALGLPRRYFVSVGRIVPSKGVFATLDSYGSLNDRLREQVGLVFVGEGPARGDLAERASRVVPGTVRWAGFVQPPDLPAYYALADALVFPTTSDPWGLVVNEAMACGLPVIASDVAGCVPDLVRDGWNGFVVAPDDRAGLSRAMATLGGDAELARRMGARSATLVREYEPARCAAGLAEAARLVASAGADR